MQCDPHLFKTEIVFVEALHLNSNHSYFFTLGEYNKIYILLGKISPI